MTAYLKGSKASWIWLLLRLYIGYEWVTAGWEKLTGAKPFDAKGFLMGATKLAAGAHPAVQPWWNSFLQGFAIPNVGLFNFLVPWGEFLVGLALIVGFATTFALVMASIMNAAYLFSGTTSTNTQLLLLQIIVLAVGAGYAGYLGADYWFRPIWQGWMHRVFTPEAAPEVKVSHT